MNPTEEKLILDMSLNRISDGQFLSSFPTIIVGNDNFFRDELTSAYQRRSGGDVELVLLIGFRFGFSANCLPILTKILPESWHKSHEDIVTILGDMKEVGAACAIYQAATSSYSYLDYDDFFNLGVKCCSSLYKIRTNESKHKLTLLLKSNHEIVADSARMFIDAWENDHGNDL